jgi:ribosomal protein S21
MQKRYFKSPRESTITVEIKGRTVYVGERDNVNSAYKRLHRLLKEEGILDLLRARESFTKPSDKRRTARSRGFARELKRQARMALAGGIRKEEKRHGNKGKSNKAELLKKQMMKDIKDAAISRKGSRKDRRKAPSNRASIQTD